VIENALQGDANSKAVSYPDSEEMYKAAFTIRRVLIENTYSY
jgi:hypothetical protein